MCGERQGNKADGIPATNGKGLVTSQCPLGTRGAAHLASGRQLVGEGIELSALGGGDGNLLAVLEAGDDGIGLCVARLRERDPHLLS